MRPSQRSHSTHPTAATSTPCPIYARDLYGADVLAWTLPPFGSSSPWLDASPRPSKLSTMTRPRTDSKCFAVHSLRRVLARTNRSDGYPGGTVKDFLVEKHLGHVVKNVNLERNFTFWWRWTLPGGEKQYKKVGLHRKKAQRGNRWDEWVRSPFENNSVTIVRLACMIKFNKQTTESMRGLVADHNNGPCGWCVADWRKLRLIPWDEDDDRGWWISGL